MGRKKEVQAKKRWIISFLNTFCPVVCLLPPFMGKTFSVYTTRGGLLYIFKLYSLYPPTPTFTSTFQVTWKVMVMIEWWFGFPALSVLTHRLIAHCCWDMRDETEEELADAFHILETDEQTSKKQKKSALVRIMPRKNKS